MHDNPASHSSQTRQNPSGTKAARALEPGDKVDNFVVVHRPVPAGTRGHLWWRKQLVSVHGVVISSFPYDTKKIFDADEVVTLNPVD